MKNKIDGIVIVEGANDASYLSSLVEAEYVILNGLALEDLNYLKIASKTKKLYIMTDPDSEGENIREKLHQELENYVDIRVDINKCTKDVKNGVKECVKTEILYQMSPYFSNESNDDNQEEIRIFDKNFRNYVCNLFGIKNCNNKTFNKRIKTLDLSDSDLEKLYKEFENGN